MDLAMRPNQNGILYLPMLSRGYGTLVDLNLCLSRTPSRSPKAAPRLLSMASTTIPSIPSCPSVVSSFHTPARAARPNGETIAIGLDRYLDTASKPGAVY